MLSKSHIIILAK